MSLPDGPTEESTERDGLLSYAGEWHALTIGLAAGLAAAMTGQWWLLVVLVGGALGLEGQRRVRSAVAREELASEPWYALGGGLIGAAVGWLATGAGALPW